MAQDEARQHVDGFIDSSAPRDTLGLVCGRRRIGKSTLLEQVASERGGFYWEATRGEPAVQLARLGEAIGERLGVGRLSLDTWDEAIAGLLRLGQDRPVPVVIDEFGYLLEADPTVDSVVASALGPAMQRRRQGKARFLLCGSAVALMSALA